MWANSCYLPCILISAVVTETGQSFMASRNPPGELGWTLGQPQTRALLENEQLNY